MDDFKYRERLRAWLETQPHEVSVAIAARVALRVLPMVGRLVETGQPQRRFDTVLSTFRCITIALVIAKYPAKATELGIAADAAFTAYSANDAAFAAAFAADAAFAAYAAADAIYAATSAATAYYAAEAAADAVVAADAEAAAVWRAISEDARFIEAGHNAHDLVARPLWANAEMPNSIRLHWNTMKRDLLAADQNWQFLINWYEAVLHGRPTNPSRDIAHALIADDIWQAGPKAVFAEMQRIEEEFSLPVPAIAPGPVFSVGTNGLALSVPDTDLEGIDKATQLVLQQRLIPTLPDQNPCAQSLNPMDMMRHGRSVSLFQASQQ